jgi:2-succinyl-6-hydroxy-2,4-cyclohexadiene-1-carboxylate synthase
MNMEIFAIHGFLGRPQDWEIIHPASLPIDNFVSIDIYDIANPTLGFAGWAKRLNSKAAKSRSPKILMGYSLGGRLALHALLQQPAYWDGAIFISTHPGLEHAKHREIRRNQDRTWSEKFIKDPWIKLMHDWNAQSAFNNTVEIERLEKNYSRNILSESLRGWSLGNQDFLIPHIAQQPIPILWATGEKDASANNKHYSLEFLHPFSRKITIPEAGHRILWDQPKLLFQHIFDFINYLTKEAYTCSVKQLNGII